MLWRVGIPTMLLALMLLAAPAAAGGVQSHIDDQGVIRIKNSGAAQPGQSPENSPSTATAAPEAGSQTGSGPPLAPAEKPNPAPDLPEAATQQNPPR